MNALLFQDIYWPKGIYAQIVWLLLFQLSAQFPISVSPYFLQPESEWHAWQNVEHNVMEVWKK